MSAELMMPECKTKNIQILCWEKINAVLFVMHWKLSSIIPLFAPCQSHPKTTDITRSCFALLHHHQHHYTVLHRGWHYFPHYQLCHPSAIGMMWFSPRDQLSIHSSGMRNGNWGRKAVLFYCIWTCSQKHLETKPLSKAGQSSIFFPCFWIIGRSMRILLSMLGLIIKQLSFKFNFTLKSLVTPLL